MAELGTEGLETLKVSVKTTAPYLVTTGFGDDGLAHAGQQRTNHQDAAAQRGTFPNELITLQIGEVEVGGLECQGSGPIDYYLHTDILQQLNQVVDVANVGDVLNGDGLAGQQRGTNDLQGLVFRALRNDGSLQRMTALDDEC